MDPEELGTLVVTLVGIVGLLILGGLAAKLYAELEKAKLELEALKVKLNLEALKVKCSGQGAREEKEGER